ncbi:MAG: TonB-dependent receptor [Porphyromonadaceae bacterium]|nr:TonB-dependent receptor [Porphyromonadaceae bacterium]
MFRKSLWVAFALLIFVSQIEAQESNLNENDSNNLQEVAVEATRMSMKLKNIPQKVEIIDKDKIASIPADNVADLLKTVTNLDIIQYPGVSGQVGMRGFAPTATSRSYTLVMIDGLPSGTSNLATLPTAVIERIEVVKGPYSILYGTDAMGGVINIITQKPTEQRRASVSLKVGSFGSTLVDASVSGMVSDKVGVVVGFNNRAQSKDYRIGDNNLMKMTDLEKTILDSKSYGDIYPNTTYQTSQLYGKVRYDISQKWAINLSSILYMGEDIKVPGNYFTRSASKKDINRFNLFGNISYKTEKNHLVVAPYFSNEKNYNYKNALNDNTNFISFRDNVKEFGIKITSNTTIDNIKILTGIDYDVLDYSSDRQSAKGTEASPYKPNNRNQRLSALIQGSYEWNNLSVNAGIRANFIRYEIFKHDSLQNEASDNNYFLFTPSIGAKYYIINGLNIHASAGRAFNIPDAFVTSGFYEINTPISPKYRYRHVYVGNSALRPETSVTYEGGVGYSNSFLSVYTTYFNTTHNDKIVTMRGGKPAAGAPDTTYYHNAKVARMSGLELMASINVLHFCSSNQKLEIYGNLTYLFNNNFTEYGTDKVKDMILVAKTNGNFGIFYDSMRGFSTRLHTRYKGSRLEKDFLPANVRKIAEADYYTGGGYETKEKILKISDHLIFDYSAYYNVTAKAKIGITISNIFDENYTEKDTYNMPGRSIMGHISYSF